MPFIQKALIMLSKMLAAVICGTIISYLYLEDLFTIIEKPLEPLHIKMISEELSEGLMLNLPLPELRFTFQAGILISAPALLWLLADFLLPALNPRERKLLFRSIFASAALYVVGVVVGYRFILPKALLLLTHWNSPHFFRS